MNMAILKKKLWTQKIRQLEFILLSDVTKTYYLFDFYFPVFKTRNNFLSPSVQFSHSVVSDSLWSHEPQQARPPCPSPTPRVYSNSCPLSQWCQISNHLILCRPLLLLPSIFPNIRVFSNKSALGIRWPRYWSFSFNISPSNEHPGLISFRIDWLDLLPWALQKLAAGQIWPWGHSLHTSTACVGEAAFQPFICQEKAGILGPPINCSGVFASKMNSK